MSDLSEVSVAIKRAEDQLRDDRCIAPCWIEIPEARTLMWDQYGLSKSWRILFAAPGLPPRPLLNCPGECRLACADHIEALITTARWAMNRSVM